MRPPVGLLSADPVRSEAGLRWPGVRVSWGQPAQGAVRPGGVVVEQAFRQYPAQMMLAGDQQPAGEPAAHGAGHRCAGGVPPVGACGGLRTILRPAAVTTAPQEPVNCPAIPDQELGTSSALAGAGQESARCRRAPQSYDRSPSRPAVEWRVARMLGFDGGHATPVPAHQRGRDRSRGLRDPAPGTSVTKRERRRSCIQVRRTLNADYELLMAGRTAQCDLAQIIHSGAWLVPHDRRIISLIIHHTTPCRPNQQEKVSALKTSRRRWPASTLTAPDASPSRSLTRA